MLALALPTLLVLAAGCAPQENPSYPEVLVQALELAEKGDPGAWALCEQLEVGRGRGDCKLEASRLMPDRAAACESIIRAHWRNECWFAYAEDLGAERKWEEAIGACRSADDYAGHCARHLWWTALQAGTADPDLRGRLAAAFPEHDDEIRAAQDDYARLQADMARTNWTAPGQPRSKSEEDAELEQRFRAQQLIDPASCEASDRCVEVARAVFVERWRRVLDRQEAVRDALCAREPAPQRLQTGGHPALEAALSDLRADVCAGATDH